MNELFSPLALQRMQQRVQLRSQRRRNTAMALNGLAACQCHGKRMNGRGLHGYRLRSISTAARRTGIGSIGASADLALIPVSDKSALVNAVKYFAAHRSAAHRSAAHRTGKNAIGYFGGNEQTSGAAAGAASGAKVGSIVPGIGTVIGAVVGAVVGWLASKPKPVRPTAEQLSACRTLLTEYMGYAEQLPNAPLPMELPQLKEIAWCQNAIHGGLMGLKDPRYFAIGIEPYVLPLAKDIVKKIYETPVGGQVNLDALTFKDPKGRNVHFQGFSFVNPVFTDLKSFSQTVFKAMLVQGCGDSAAKKSGCQAYHDLADTQRWMYDMLAYAARITLPNISEADLRAASQVAQQTGSAAKDVVTAVEQIINRNVIKGETAALLTGQTDQPGVTAPTPIVAVPPSTAPPLPGVTTQAASDVTALISQLVAQNASTNAATQAALNALAAQGTPITPAVTDAVQKEVVAQQAGGIASPWLAVGGVVAALFLLARPAKRGRR